ncbi:MAG: cysteine desulfurase NifS [Candidatus Moranbacteria bacterium CG08_land_8_20_14_0_20_34_16]|nr:MAG: cysteine desulfurase NifS [Candidatus Moranbacteria bacterium CG08_land_8_20_14_0_20_34_16]
MKKKIYLDHGATTPVDKRVFLEMMPYFSEKYGNASSLHSFGKDTLDTVEKSRLQLARFFGAEAEEIFFTSGATEANNLAVKGIVKAYYAKNKNDYSVSKPHIITTSFEHHCVLESCQTLEKENLAKVSYILPQKDGLVRVSDIEKAIQKNTLLISAMYVNNEIGTVQPIAEIGKIVKKNNLKKSLEKKIFFHTDATQAVNYFDCKVEKLGVDMLSLSAHKIYGPKGVGALYVKKGTPIKPILNGGGQEKGLRSGTTNSCGIIGFGKAVALLSDKKNAQKNKETLELRNFLIEKILKEIPDSRLNGSREKRSPNNANFSFKNVEGESLLMMLDAEGLACSTGSACSSGSLEPSHVLLSIGLLPEEAHGSLRITLGRQNTQKEIENAVKIIKKVVSKLRSISGKVLDDYYAKK